MFHPNHSANSGTRALHCQTDQLMVKPRVWFLRPDSRVMFHPENCFDQRFSGVSIFNTFEEDHRVAIDFSHTQHRQGFAKPDRILGDLECKDRPWTEP
jgi:hypothetical protein